MSRLPSNGSLLSIQLSRFLLALQACSVDPNMVTINLGRVIGSISVALRDEGFDEEESPTSDTKEDVFELSEMGD